VTATQVFVPLLLEPYDPFGSAKWRPAQIDIKTSDRLYGINSITVLFDETTLARPPNPALP
jgi:hypothetical protein